ncbi:MAG TPA: DUF308 domain-containing protein [Devosiaceae bacterium]|jgi:uncharacterized membrane protein HdeD (DUF308 family)
MASLAQSARRSTALTALRGVIMIIAGLFALADPTGALRFLVFVGGGVLLIDGILNIAALRFDGPRDTAFWIGVIRGVFAILAGLAVLLSPWLTEILSLNFLRYFVGLQATGVGLIEILGLVVPKPQPGSQIWPALVSGGAYALFGLALILMPLSGATTLVSIVAVLMIVYACSLFVRVWRQRTAPR